MKLFLIVLNWRTSQDTKIAVCTIKFNNIRTMLHNATYFFTTSKEMFAHLNENCPPPLPKKSLNYLRWLLTN